jgi:hypothetical protein
MNYKPREDPREDNKQLIEEHYHMAHSNPTMVVRGSDPAILLCGDDTTIKKSRKENDTA